MKSVRGNAGAALHLHEACSLNRNYATDFENMNMYTVSSSHSAIFLIQSIRNVFVHQNNVFKFLSDQGMPTVSQQSRILIRFFGLQLPSTLLIPSA